jgi:uncharacterized protein (TIGR00290 family)
VEPILLSWSGGKDSALALHRLRTDRRFEVTGLVTTIISEYDRVSVHGVRRSLLHQQAAGMGLPLQEIELAPASSNELYQAAWKDALAALPPPMREARRIAFGDIFLEDVRHYREALAQAQGYGTVFPLWAESTQDLAEEVFRVGIAATLVCVDLEVLPQNFAGRSYDCDLVAALPAGIDPCGERGEFHTFVSDGPEYTEPVEFSLGDTMVRDGRFAFRDLVPAGAPE